MWWLPRGFCFSLALTFCLGFFFFKRMHSLLPVIFLLSGSKVSPALLPCFQNALCPSFLEVSESKQVYLLGGKVWIFIFRHPDQRYVLSLFHHSCHPPSLMAMLYTVFKNPVLSLLLYLPMILKAAKKPYEEW